jgi:hypothetical protein
VVVFLAALLTWGFATLLPFKSWTNVKNFPKSLKANTRRGKGMLRVEQELSKIIGSERKKREGNAEGWAGTLRDYWKWTQEAGKGMLRAESLKVAGKKLLRAESLKVNTREREGPAEG